MLIHGGEVIQENSHLDVIEYSQFKYSKCHTIPEHISRLRNQYWINLEGLGSIEEVNQLANIAKAHKLQIEDILNFDHRPKVESINGTLLLIFKRFDLNEQLALNTEQISLLLRENKLVSFQERSGNSFDHIRKTLDDPTSYLRGQNITYLFYRMIDSIADSYFEITDELEDRITDLENWVIGDDPRVDLAQILQIKKTTYVMRKHIRSMCEVIMDLRQTEHFNMDQMDVFFTDVNDHLSHILEQCDHIMEATARVISIYHSNSGNRLNEIMKRLTLVSTIFIPLSFLAGLYGMNFSHMPELNAPYGYPILLGVMALIAVLIYRFMKRSRWF